MPELTTPQQMTVEDFLALAEDPSVRRELIEGEVVVVNLPLFAHEQAVLNLALELKLWAREAAGRGTLSLPIDTAAGPTSILGPDPAARRRPRSSTMPETSDPTTRSSHRC